MGNVLVFADDLITRDALAAMLRGGGHQTSVISDTNIGAGIGRAGNVDLLVTEYVLPDLRGMRLLQELRQAGNRAPAILLARFGHTSLDDRLLAQGNYSFLEQPISKAVLLELVNAAIRDKVVSGVAALPCSAVRTTTGGPYSLRRWARVVVRGALSATDMRTIAEWGRVAGVSAGGLKNWCGSAGISARQSLGFVRVLRGALQPHRGHHAAQDLLDIVDRRTLAKLLIRGGGTADSLPPDVDTFFREQMFVQRRLAVEMVRAELTCTLWNLQRPSDG